VVAAPHLSLNQLANREGRCRKQMAKLLRASWLSPQIVETVVSGSQPRSFNRQRLLEAELPVDWSEQVKVLGFA
jgi:hypothetical protein